MILNPTGFEGKNCSQEINECGSNPCAIVGTESCIDHLDNYTCVCKLGYRGRHCEINIDECEMHVCLNGASCMDDVNGYR